MNHHPTVSVIIPCYNQGQYLAEAVTSVLAQTYQDFEIIVINDGSTESETLAILADYSSPKTTILHTDNQGVARARNLGISKARGKYILPLDADDKIAATYLAEAVKLLESNEKLGIVYCEAEYFGDRSGKWELKPYDFPAILLENMIFCSGFFRKSDWENTGGYNSNLVYGWEDYDFWLSLIELGREVYRIPETLFFYRQKESSRTREMTFQNSIDSYVTIFKNHPSLYLENLDFLFATISKNKELIGGLLNEKNQYLERIQDLENYGQRLEKELKKAEEDLCNSEQEAARLAQVIDEMEKSKFWQLRNLWFRGKKWLGLGMRS